MKNWKKAFLGIGSNMGDRKAIMERAVEGLKAQAGIRQVHVSAWVETEPYGYTEQGLFLNGAVGLETIYSPLELLKVLQKLEEEADRKRDIRWGPRTLDLDLLLYDQEIIDLPELKVPHYDMTNRLFVLQPLAEIAAEEVHPVLKKTIKELLELLLDS